MKLLSFLLVAFLLLGTMGCASRGDSVSQEPSASDSLNWESVNIGDCISLPQYELFDLIVTQKLNGNSFTNSSADESLLIVNDKNSVTDSKNYLIVKTSTELLTHQLQSTALENDVYCCDVTGDKFDEIIVHQHIDDFGGAGQYSSYIFAVDGDIRELFCSNNENVFDTGFTTSNLEDYRLQITNSRTGYKTILDVSERYYPEAFDEKGKLRFSEKIAFDSFFEFEPQDVNGDGTFEVSCAQYAYMQSHSDGVGIAKSILSFDKKTRTFEVVETTFDIDETGDGSVS